MEYVGKTDASRGDISDNYRERNASAEGIGAAGVEDESGASESSEGIIDHDPFNKGRRVPKPDERLRNASPYPNGSNEAIGEQAAQKELEKEMPPAATI